MGGLGTWLVSLAAPAVSRVFAALGIGVMTFMAVDVAVTTAISASKAAFSGVAGSTMQILALGGIPTALSIIAGGINAGISLMVFKKFSLK